MTPTNQQVPPWLGPLLMIVSVTIMRFGEPSPGVPHWIAYLACSTFFMAGIILTAMSFGFDGVANWIGPLIVIAMGTILTWIAFGPGERACTGSISFLFFWQKHHASGAGCRIPFGIAAVLTWIIFAVAFFSTLSKKGKP